MLPHSADWLTALRVKDVGLTLTALGVMFGIFAPVPAYWHQKGDFLRRDSALLIPYSFLVYFFIPVPFLIGARLHLPLQDERFARLDHALGVNVGAIVEWVHRHGLTHVSNLAYNSLFFYLAAAVFIPALTGKSEGRRFLVANVLAFLIGVPCCALLPAIGPWYSEHFAVGRSHIGVQEQVRHSVPLRRTLSPFWLTAPGSWPFPPFTSYGRFSPPQAFGDSAGCASPWFSGLCSSSSPP